MTILDTVKFCNKFVNLRRTKSLVKRKLPLVQLLNDGI